MRKELFTLYDKSKTSPDDQKLYKLKLKKFRKKCSKESQKDARRIQEIVENEQEMAKHINMMTESSSPKLSTLTLKQGRSTDPGKETGKALLEAHYPGIRPKKGTRYDRNKSVFTNLLQEKYNWINVERLKTVFQGFKAKKSPGPDSLSPQVLMQLPINILKYIIIIHKACMALHFTPTTWKNSTIIFIPKPGKTSYTDPKSFRPISLSNYLLKALEKLCVWNTDEALEANPLSIQQHGFQRGKCTDSAISKTVNYIEQSLDKNKQCLAVFLDIKGAFDTICPKYVRKSLKAKGINKDLIEWYYNYITHRNIEFKNKDFEITGTIDMGFPQGGVCSANFWIIAFDYALDIINTDLTEGQGFADDLCILTQGTESLLPLFSAPAFALSKTYGMS